MKLVLDEKTGRLYPPIKKRTEPQRKQCIADVIRAKNLRVLIDGLKKTIEHLEEMCRFLEGNP